MHYLRHLCHVHVYNDRTFRAAECISLARTAVDTDQAKRILSYSRCIPNRLGKRTSSGKNMDTAVVRWHCYNTMAANIHSYRDPARICRSILAAMEWCVWCFLGHKRLKNEGNAEMGNKKRKWRSSKLEICEVGDFQSWRFLVILIKARSFLVPFHPADTYSCTPSTQRPPHILHE